MAIAEELQIIVDAKVNAAIADLKKVSKTIDGTGKSTSKLSGLFKQLAGPLAIGAVVAGTIKMGKEFSNAARDAEEIESKFRTVYRSIGDEAEESAQRLADSFDLADSTAQELLGTTGDLLTGLGFTQSEALGLSEQVNTLAIDLASFSNYSGGASGASEALTKALLGESEMAKGLGIVINQNTAEYKDAIKYYTEVEGKTLLQAKAYTALQFATEQSGNAIGDYARTSESTANTFRRLNETTKEFKELLGSTLNEGITPMVGGLATFIAKVNEAITAQRDLNIALDEASGRTFTNTAEGLMALENGYKEIQNRITTLRDNIKENENSENSYRKASVARSKEALALLEQQARSLENQLMGRARLLTASELQRFETMKAIEAEEETAKAIDASTDAIIKNHTAVVSAGQDWLSLEQAKVEHLIMIDELETEISNRRLAEAAAEKQAAEDLMQAKITMAFQYANSAIDLISAIAGYQSASADAELQQMEDAEASEEELDKKRKQIAHDQAVRKRDLGLLNVAIDTASAIVGFLANPGGVAGIALSALAGATGAIQAAAISAAPIPAYASGGSFVANGATPIMVGEGGGSERVTVTPIGGGSGEENQTMILSIDGTNFTGWLQNKINNGNIRIPRRVIV